MSGFRLSILAGVAFGLALSASAQQVDQARGADERVDYEQLLQYGPWDDRNYELTLEDLEHLARNEAELRVHIPAFFRVEMRKMNPDMLREGPCQYPRSAPEIFRLMYGGLLVDGVVESRSGEVEADVPVNGEVEVRAGAESAVAISPADPKIAIAGINAWYGGQQMLYSTDGGDTWLNAGILSGSCCDPTVVWSSDGSVGYTATLKSCGFSLCKVAAWRTTDNGVTWTGEKVLTNSGCDKEYLHVDAFADSPYKDNVYLTWHKYNTLQFARSTDLGVTWSTPLNFSNDARGIGSDICTDRSGDVYYIWPGTSTRQIWYKRSTDGGASFSSAAAIDSTNASFDFPVPAMETRGGWVYVSADTDLSDGTYSDSVYAAWTDTTAYDGSVAANNHAVIRVAFSRDHGLTWTTVSPHATDDTSEVDRLNQWMEVDDNGAIHLVYYTTEYVHPSRTSVDLAYVFSSDGGQTWNGPTRVTSVSSPNISDSFEFGDYNGMDMTLAKVLPIWTDNRSESRADSVDVYVADLTNKASPEAGSIFDDGFETGDLSGWTSPKSGAPAR